MVAKVDAYDKRTGKKLPNRVPEKWFELPKFRDHLRKTPIQKAREAESKKEG